MCVTNLARDREGAPPRQGRTRPRGGDRKRSIQPGSSGDLVHVNGMAAYRSGPLKQQNKRIKAGGIGVEDLAQRDGKGKKVGWRKKSCLIDINCCSSCPE